MKRAVVLIALAACSPLPGLGGAEPPFATYTVEVAGDLAAVQADSTTPDLHVALVWGEQWLTEALCLEAPGSPVPTDARDDATTVGPVLAAGCRDPFGFVPLRVAANVAVDVGTPATFVIDQLPNADDLVGDLTARVAYGSMVVYDDRNGNGTLDLARPNRLGNATGMPTTDPTPTMQPDRVYGASFISMTLPDQRVGYREGAFLQAAAFYPRAGCDDPPPAFSVLAAGGFSEDAAIAAAVQGTLPPETACAQAAPEAVQIAVALQSPTGVAELGCTENNADSSVRYREPTSDMPDFTNRQMACVHLPSFGTPLDAIELIVTGRSDDGCVGLTHYVLTGCRTDASCADPTWDHSAAPPSWWPC